MVITVVTIVLKRSELYNLNKDLVRELQDDRALCRPFSDFIFPESRVSREWARLAHTLVRSIALTL